MNVWYGIINEKLIGPYFFNENLNLMTFLRFLLNEFSNDIDELPLDYRYNLRLQFDEATIHNAVIVRDWSSFSNWIGKNSPLVLWPPRSPDLTLLDFFLWGIIKNEVYKSRAQTGDELYERVRVACRAETAQTTFICGLDPSDGKGTTPCATYFSPLRRR